MSVKGLDFSLAIGGAAGQGIATPGNILARIFARRGLNLYAYNAYQSIIRGGHIFLTIRCSDEGVRTHGDTLDLLLCLNQDTMDRHVGHLGPGSRVVYNGDKIEAGETPNDVLLCPMPVDELTGGSKNKLIQNTVSPRRHDVPCWVLNSRHCRRLSSSSSGGRGPPSSKRT